jgi:thioredoxin-like negative regulator of GroEL
MNGRAIPGACALVEDKCLNHFKTILKKREVQSALDRFLTSPSAKRQRPATEEQETYLE